MRLLILLLAFGSACLGPAENAVAGQTASTIGVQARVPLICRVHDDGTPATPLQGTSIDLGSTDEYCNNAHGYRLVLRHAAFADGARLLVDGRSVAIPSGETETMIAESDGPVYHGHRHLELILGGTGPADPMLSLEMDPKGAS